MNTQTTRRRRLLVDYRVQGALIGRVLIYWVLCLLGVLVIRATLSGLCVALDIPWSDTGSLWLSQVLASCLFVPFVVVDVLRMTNRFVGPMYRLRRQMERLAQGEAVAPIAFRKGDMWHDFAQAFNDLRSRMDMLSGRTPETPSAAEEDATPVEIGA